MWNYKWIAIFHIGIRCLKPSKADVFNPMICTDPHKHYISQNGWIVYVLASTSCILDAVLTLLLICYRPWMHPASNIAYNLHDVNSQKQAEIVCTIMHIYCEWKLLYFIKMSLFAHNNKPVLLKIMIRDTDGQVWWHNYMTLGLIHLTASRILRIQIKVIYYVNMTYDIW